MSDMNIKRRAGRPKAEEAERKRRGLILVALEEFARMGFHRASLREIAEMAQVSSRTLYNHHPDKISLFEACLEYSGKEIRPVLPDFKGDLRAKLIAYTSEMQRQLSAPLHMQITRLIFRESSDSQELREIAREQFERHQVMPLADILEQDGISEQHSHSLAKQFIVMATGELQRRMLFGGPLMTMAEMAAHAELVTGIFLEGMKAVTQPSLT